MPFKSPNYTQTPNDLFDDLLPSLGQAELKIALALIRLTFGYHRIRVRRSLSKLSKMTGLTEANVIAGIRGLEERGLIIKRQDGGVNIYELTLEEPPDDITAPIATIGAEQETPIATIGRTIKETVNKRNEDNKGQAPRETLHRLLDPSTSGAYMLFNLLGDERAAKGYRPPKNFPTTLCKEKFIAAEERLGEIELEQAIRRGIEKGITSITNLTDWVTKWAAEPSPKRKGFTILDETTPVDFEQVRAKARAIIDQSKGA